VTHDQEEALTMSDRIAVMEGGKVTQIGDPLEIYNHPSTRFVSNFIGDSNIFEGRAKVSAGDDLKVTSEDGFEIAAKADNIKDGQGVTLAVRPEKIQFVAPGENIDNELTGEVESVNFLGNAILYRLVLPAGRLILAQMPNSGAIQIRHPGESVRLGWSRTDGIILTD
jgi:putative spermidine/putrescine transport system ATP-binding protein